MMNNLTYGTKLMELRWEVCFNLLFPNDNNSVKRNTPH